LVIENLSPLRRLKITKLLNYKITKCVFPVGGCAAEVFALSGAEMKAWSHWKPGSAITKSNDR